MKKLTNLVLILLVFLITLIGCSKDDSVNELNDEFLTAQVDGADWSINKSTGIISCEKIITSRGVINLLIKARSVNGDYMELYIDNYVGKRAYTFGDNILNDNKMSFSQYENGNSWNVLINPNRDKTLNNLEVLDDNGKYLKGSFNFEGTNMKDMSIKKFQNGNFNFKIRSENQQ